MNLNKALWEKGDFTRIAATMRESGEALVEAIRRHEGHEGARPRVRRRDDGRAGSKTRRGRARCRHRRRPLVEAANRARASSRLDEPDDPTRAMRAICKTSRSAASIWSVSIFGAMFAPKPVRGCQGDGRVTRPGGRIAMGNWIPNDPTLVAQILKISSPGTTAASPEGFISPMTWGSRAT